MKSDITYELIETKRKSIGIYVREDASVLVRAPFGVKKKTIDTLVQKRADWIAKAQNEIQKRNKQRKETSLKEGQKIYLLGKPYRLQMQSDQKEDAVLLKEDTLVLMTKANQIEYQEAVLEAFYRIKAKQYLSERVQVFAKKMGVTFGRITIKNQKTRWGSCSSKGNLNFNWKIMMAPIEVIDYLVVHELAHRKEMNHSSRFYAEMQKIMPDYKVWQRWLKENGKTLTNS